MEQKTRGGKRSGAGRPAKQNAKTTTIAISCTAEEKRMIDGMAQAVGLSRSEYIIRSLFRR